MKLKNHTQSERSSFIALFRLLTGHDGADESGPATTITDKIKTEGLNQKMFWYGLLYSTGIWAPPILLGFAWWGWFHRRGFERPKWRALLLLSAIGAGTINFTLFWGFVVWLRSHYTPESWRVRDPLSTICFYMLLYSVLAAVLGKGRYRVLIGLTGVLAMVPWIPMGVL
jgi:hypothetical protein